MVGRGGRGEEQRKTKKTRTWKTSSHAVDKGKNIVWDTFPLRMGRVSFLSWSDISIENKKMVSCKSLELNLAYMKSSFRIS